MNKQEKAQMIEDLTEKVQNNSHFYVTDASGLTVAQVNDLRGKCFKAGIEYKVVKNTLLRKALERAEGDYEQLYDELKGFSGVMFSPEIGNAPAKVIKEFRGKDGLKPSLKVAYLDTDVFIGDDQVKVLSELKSKDELVGEIIGLLQSPAKNVISALQSGKNILGGLVKTLQERAQ